MGGISESLGTIGKFSSRELSTFFCWVGHSHIGQAK